MTMKQKLLTKEIEKRFEKHPIYSQQGKEFEAEVLVRFFNPYGAGEWVIIEAEYDQEQKDWLMYGYCSLGYGFELGYVYLKQLQDLDIKFGPFSTNGIERDAWLKKGARVKDVLSLEDLM